MSGAGMVVWLNGSFGAGKTTVAEILAGAINAAVFDPEPLGAYLKASLPADLGMPDFQDLPEWRTATRSVVRAIASRAGRPVVVPMTLVVPEYFEELVGGLRDSGVDVRHFTLRTSRATAAARLALRGDTTPWAFAQVGRCVDALDDRRFADHIEADDRSACDVADEICARLGF